MQALQNNTTNNTTTNMNKLCAAKLNMNKLCAAKLNMRKLCAAKLNTTANNTTSRYTIDSQTAIRRNHRFPGAFQAP